MQAQPCLKTSEDEKTRTIEAYLGGTDEDKEGTWTTLYSRETIEVSRASYCQSHFSPLSAVQHLPWGVNRPYTDGERYNSLLVESEMSWTGRPHYRPNYQKTSMKDELSSILYCPLCRLDGEVSVVRIRGLCQESIFDTEYLLTLDPAGRLLYLGKYSSSIAFNSSSQVWQWFDQKNNKSQAIRYINIFDKVDEVGQSRQSLLLPIHHQPTTNHPH